MIYINGRFLVQPLTGVNRYAYELCKALMRAKMDFVIVCPNNRLNDSYDITGFRLIKFGIGSSHFWEQLCFPFFFIFKQKFLLINFTGLGPILVKRKVITIHDLAYLENPAWYSKYYYVFYKYLTPISAKTSLKVLTVSEFSKVEIINKLGINNLKIEVVSNAVSEVMKSVRDHNESIKGKYILAVSSVDPRKNLINLIKGFELLNEIDLRLYIIGGKNRVFAENELYNMTSDRVHFLGRVSDDELKCYYENALAFVYPSLYEGFGLPPIEAMAMGCPTIISDIPVLHEVCGDASFYINPLDCSDIALKINLLYANAILRDKLIDKGYQRVLKYNWDNSAQRIIDIINYYG